MKRREHILQTVALLAGLCGLIFYTVRRGSPFLITLLISLGIVLLYAFLMQISERAGTVLMALPYVSRPNRRALLALSIQIALPLYLCLFCTACIPLFRWELWILTGFPVLLLLAAPLYAIMEELHDRRLPRRFFWGIQLPLIAAIYLLGQAVAWALVRLPMLVYA